MFRLLKTAQTYNLSAHASNLPNLIAGTMGMLINNILFLTGMWGMLFAGKPENHHLLFYYVALNALVMTSWGALNFFFGGWIDLGELITNGHFESKLATPRHPLLLVATHNLHPSALGDLLMGLVGIVVLFIWGPEGMGLRTLVSTVLAGVAYFSLFVLSGSLAFFISRGNLLAVLVREISMSLSCYPIGKIFPSGMGRIALLLTPAAATSLLPMEWIESAGALTFAYATLGVAVSVAVAMAVFTIGVKRFQSISLIGPQS